MCALVTGVQTCSSDLSRPPDCQRCRGEDRQTTMGGRIRMSDFTRRDVLKTTVAAAAAGADRKSVVKGKSVSVRVDLGGRRIITKKRLTRHDILVTYDIRHLSRTHSIQQIVQHE